MPLGCLQGGSVFVVTKLLNPQELSDGAVRALFAHLDGAASGFVSRAEWTRALAGADADAVLQSRGVVAAPPPAQVLPPPLPGGIADPRAIYVSI